MTITRVRLSHHPGRQAGRRRHPCPGQRPHPWLRHLHRNHTKRRGIHVQRVAIRALPTMKATGLTGGLRLSKNSALMNVGAGDYTGPWVKSSDFTHISIDFATFTKGPMCLNRPIQTTFLTRSAADLMVGGLFRVLPGQRLISAVLPKDAGSPAQPSGAVFSARGYRQDMPALPAPYPPGPQQCQSS